MVQSLFLVPVILSFFILIMPSRVRFYYVLSLISFIVVLSTIPASYVLFRHGTEIRWNLTGIPIGSLTVTIDGISAFFILLMNFAMMTGVIYSRGYLEPYCKTKSAAQLALHNFSYTWLYLSMLGVVLLRDGLPFLIAWELMAVSSFMLILFEAEKRDTLKTAVNYLVQMHIGLVLLVIAFLLCEADTGRMSFDALSLYFSRHTNTGLFFLFFAGFAMKAGFIPFHTWLPSAHPAAPSHISGLMSGVMIKMGIYGMIRVLTHLQSDFFYIGIIILVVSCLSGLTAIMMAIMRHDLKKILAYSSIENIGIIGIGMGLGTMGLGLHNQAMILLGFAGAFLHILNHSLFKPLLFFSTGAVYKAYHTREIEDLGGIIHKMPHTAFTFLIGAMAISGLPPLNGFISELLIYMGLIKGLSGSSVYASITLMLAIVALSLIGGLAVFCFTRAFGIAFLGSPRKKIHQEIQEAGNIMLYPQYFLIGMIFIIGLFPVLFFVPIAQMISLAFQADLDTAFLSTGVVLTKVATVNILLVFIAGGLFLLRQLVMRKKTVEYGPTWGCGYTAGSSRQQYTGTSYAANFGELAQPLLNSEDDYTPIEEKGIFPLKRSYRMFPRDIFKTSLNKLMDLSMLALKKLARLQTGNIQHYILYAFLFIMIVFVLLYLKIL